MQQAKQGNNQKLIIDGKVFTINGAEASESNSVIRGNCFTSRVQLFVLFSSGATHSFMFSVCVKKFKFPTRELDIDLMVSTPTDGVILTSFMCVECLVIIVWQRYKINLICIPMKDL